MPCLILITGCTYRAEADKMVASPGSQPSAAPDYWQQSLCVRAVEGGEKFNLMSAPGVVEDDAFRSALQQTLERSHLVAKPDSCKYYMDVNLLGISQPSQGLFVASVQAISHINYKIFNADQKPVFLDTVSASFTAGAFESFAAVARVEHAVEGSVRSNFEQFLQHLQARPPAP